MNFIYILCCSFSYNYSVLYACPFCISSRSNRDAKQTLEMDWSDKHQAYSLDNQCGRYSNTSSETQHQAGSAKIQDQ